MKENKLVEGKHYYFNPEGLLVFKELYHLEKGFCCGLGCKHCPYDYENVPDDKKPELLTSLEKKRINNHYGCF